MRFRGLDLNLLATFVMLMEERSVSRVAERLNLGQPAVSGGLARLRDYFQDDLLVVSGRRMIPTPLAETLWPQVSAVLEDVGTILDNAARFLPATSSREFRIAGSDYAVLVLLQPLFERLADLAPNLKLLVEQTDDRTVDRLQDGHVDLLVIPEEFISPHHPAELLFEDRYVVVGSSDNPALAQPISREEFCEREQVTALLGTNVPTAGADRQFDQMGVRRRIVRTVPHFSTLPWMVVGTPWIGVVQERLARRMAGVLPIAISPLPFDLPPIREMVQYHHSRAGDAGLAWIRQQMAAVPACSLR